MNEMRAVKPQDIVLGHYKISYMTDGIKLENVQPRTIEVVIHRTPKKNLKITYIATPKESFYDAVMAVGRYLIDYSTIDLSDISGVSYAFGEWYLPGGNTTFATQPHEYFFDIFGDPEDGGYKYPHQILAKIMNSAVSECVLFSALYFGDHDAAMKIALGSTADLVGEAIPTYGLVIIDNFITDKSWYNEPDEGPFDIIYYYVHPSDNDKIWAVSEDELKDIQKLGTKFNLMVGVNKEYNRVRCAIKDYERPDGKTEEAITQKKVMEIINIALDFLFFYSPSTLGQYIPTPVSKYMPPPPITFGHNNFPGGYIPPYSSSNGQPWGPL